MYYRLEDLNLAPEETVDYLRKSQSDDPLLTVEEVLAKHEKILDEWSIKHLGGKTPENQKFREIVSGETLKERPEVQKVLRLIESPKIRALKIVEPQRLTRGDLEDIGRVMKLLKLTNTLVITPDEWGGQRIYDLNDEYDWNAFEGELKKGNDYLNYYKKIQKRGRYLSVAAGNFIGNRAPYGYNRIKIPDGKKECHTLEINPDEAPVVKLIFDLYLKGYGAFKIMDRLHELGIRSPRGKRWSQTSIRTILANEHYIGKVRWDYKKTVQTVKDGEIVTSRPTAENYLLYPGKHPAIIDEETFYAVQRKKGSLPKHKKGTTLVNPLAGILYCSCGMAIKYHKYVKDGVVRAEPRYSCTYPNRCENASCVAAELLSVLKNSLREIMMDFEVRVESGEDDSFEIHNRLVERLERKLQELEELELAQWDKYTKKEMPKRIFDKLNAQVVEEIEEVQQALCTAKDSTPEPLDLKEKLSTLKEILNQIDDPNANITKLNALLKTCIERITYRRPRAKSENNNSRWETGNKIELDIDLKVRV